MLLGQSFSVAFNTKLQLQNKIEASVAQWLSHMPFKSEVAGSIQGSPVLRIETINRGPMTIVQDKLLTRTYRDKAGDYAVPVVLSPRDIVFRQKLYTHIQNNNKIFFLWLQQKYNNRVLFFGPFI